jgi:hypothetical protein
VICRKSQAVYEQSVRLRPVTLTTALLLALVAAAPALATDYRGDVDYWGRFTVSINNNRVTALQGLSGSVPCGNGFEIDPVDFALSAPVRVVDGRFHAAGTSLDPYQHTINWSLDASVSVSRTISGSVTISGTDPLQRATCSKTFRVAAIIPPRNLVPPAQTNFVDATSVGSIAPRVNFDYRNGVVTHLSANAGTACGQAEMGASLYSTASELTRYRSTAAASASSPTCSTTTTSSPTSSSLGGSEGGPPPARSTPPVMKTSTARSCTARGTFAGPPEASEPPHPSAALAVRTT